MTSHDSRTIRIVATLASYSLVAASAGFGALFAYNIGIQHSLPLAILTIIFAVSLELLKPLAVVSAFHAAYSWQFIRCACLGVLAAVAITYSLTAELSLVSGSRADLTSKREELSFTASANRSAYETAKRELDALAPSRPLEEVQALLEKKETTKLLAEEARAKRKLELEAAMKTALGSSGGRSLVVADPASEALRTYFLAVGWDFRTATISQWMLLVPILAIEVGSALSLVLLNSLKPQHGSSRQINGSPNEPSIVAEPLPPMFMRTEAAVRILSHLQSSGGSRISERELAKRIGLDRNTTRRAMLELSHARLIAHEPSKKGTALKLLS